MSLETTIDNFISDLKSESSTLRGDAVGLIAQAQAAFSGAKPPQKELKFSPSRSITPPNKTPARPTITIDELSSPALGSLSPITIIEEEFSGTSPTYKEPNSINTTLTKPPLYLSEAPPGQPALRTEVDFSIIPDEPTPPELTQPTVVTADALSEALPSINRPITSSISEDFLEQYNALKGWFNTVAAPVHEVLANLTNGLSGLDDELLSVLIDAFNGVYSLPKEWITESYLHQQQALHDARWTALNEWDYSPSAITGLPTGLRWSARLAIDQATTKDSALAIAKINATHREQESKYRAWALELTEKLVSAAGALYAATTGPQLSVIELALDGAVSAVELSLKTLRWEQRRLGFLQKYFALQQRMIEGWLKIEQSKLEALRIAVESNQIIASYNTLDTQVYSDAMTLIELRVQYFQIQLSVMATDQKLEGWKLKGFELSLQEYLAEMRRTQAEYDLRAAEIKKDQVRTQGQLGTVKLYQAKVKASRAELLGELATINGQIAQNKQNIASYNAMASAFTEQMRQYDTALQVAIRALLKGISAEASSAELILADQALTDKVALDNARMDLQYEGLKQALELKKYLTTLMQQRTQGKVIAGGSRVLAGAANSVYGGLNAVAAKEIVEEA